ncbi:MAG: ABC transporter permease [Pseudomonadota bacterium]
MLYTLLEATRAAWGSIIAHGFRSLLTTLGIIIGVASVIAVISLVQGLRESISAEFQALGSNSLTVRSYTPFEERLQGLSSRISADDYQLIRERVNGIDTITPVLFSEGSAGQVVWAGQSTLSQVQGTTYSFPDAGNFYPEQGRFLTLADDQKRRRVCVLGPKVVEDLGIEKPLGEFITIGGEWVKVVGVMESRGDMLGMSQDDYVLLPFETMRGMNGVQNEPDIVLQVGVADGVDMETVEMQISTLLRKAHGLSPADDDDFRVQTPEQISASFDQIINTVTIIVSGIVGISLIVGGIGIMNIMLVSVTERTREIGICKALGARRHHILLQFLLEALALSILGGLIGLVLGYGIGVLIASFVPDFPPVSVPWWAILISLGFSGAIGVLFGILPASKAADLHPIDALRYE